MDAGSPPRDISTPPLAAENNSDTNGAAPVRDSVLPRAIAELKAGPSLIKCLNDFASAGAKLKEELNGKADLHCLLVCPSQSRTGEVILPIFSDDLHTAARKPAPFSTIACQALADSLMVIRKIAQSETNSSASSTVVAVPPAEAGPKTTPSYILPHWVSNPEPARPELSNGNNARAPIYIICEESMMASLLRGDTRKIANAYGEFISALYGKARELRIIKGPLLYRNFTPPWMRSDIIFVYGPNRNCTIPFSGKELPRKNVFRQAGKKSLGCAIIVAWLKKEPSSAPLLEHILAKNGFKLPAPSSTINTPAPLDSPPDNDGSSGVERPINNTPIEEAGAATPELRMAPLNN